MKVRAQRTHFTGISNRDKEDFNSTTNIKTQSVFQRSFNKSKSLYTKSLIDTGSLADRKIQDTRGDPLAGFHHQFDTQRFDKMNIKPYKYQKMKIPKNHPMITFAPQLNSQIKNIKQQFMGKPINLHKLDQLKHTFVKNNRDRRNLASYFDNYAKNGIVDFDGLKKIVKDYGFDINQDQAKLIFRLTNRANKTDQEKQHLTMDGFVQLMTRNDVYYQTLQLNQPSFIGDHNPQITFSQNFTDKVHEVLRNKFPRLKQAFKIYRQRNQEVGQKQYDYVMKKLDLTDLVLTQNERQQIFKKYSNQKEHLNVEGLICAIAEQQHNNRKSNAYKSDFLKDIQANEEMDFSKSQKIRGFSLKDLSSLQYQNQFYKARAVIDQLSRIRNKRKQNHEDVDLFKNMANDTYASRQQVVKNVEKILKKQGINFHKQDYEAFGAYLNFDSDGNIPINKVSQQLFTQTEKQARERFQRKVRNEAPKVNLQNKSQISDQKTAINCLNRLKSHRMNPETRELFKYFDENKDGYVSATQFKQKISALHIMENWQIQNLADYLKVNEEGSINYHNFSKKLGEVYKKEQNQFPIVRNRNSKSCYDWSETTKLKKTFINDSNQTAYQRPTKFSAWPSNITTQNLTLVQPPTNAGTYASEAERFNERKQDYGLKQKMFAMAVAQNRRLKKAEWNSVLQQRADLVRQKQQQRAAARNYALRLTKEKYELNCHQ